jgi:hypothetical protein
MVKGGTARGTAPRRPAAGKGARASTKIAPAQWGWRLSGLGLCAFFVMGVLAGVSVATGHGHQSLRRLLRLRRLHLGHALEGPGSADSAVAVIERADGLYLLAADGELKGPLSSRMADGLPVMSGPGLDNARGGQLLADAELMVRAEGLLSEMVSEMRVDNGQTAALFLEQTHTRVIVNLDRGAGELARAGAILRRWRAHQDLISAIDMTIDGEAVLSLREPLDVALRQLENGALSNRTANRELASR